MKALGALLLLVCLVAVVRFFLPYSLDTLRLGVAYTAKEFCSCLYVVRQNEEFCRELVSRVDRISISMEADHKERRTRASLYGIERRAYCEGERTGCRLGI